jgi:hypothetical protein
MCFVSLHISFLPQYNREQYAHSLFKKILLLVLLAISLFFYSCSVGNIADENSRMVIKEGQLKDSLTSSKILEKFEIDGTILLVDVIDEKLADIIYIKNDSVYFQKFEIQKKKPLVPKFILQLNKFEKIENYLRTPENLEIVTSVNPFPSKEIFFIRYNLNVKSRSLVSAELLLSTVNEDDYDIDDIVDDDILGDLKVSAATFSAYKGTAVNSSSSYSKPRLIQSDDLSKNLIVFQSNFEDNNYLIYSVFDEQFNSEFTLEINLMTEMAKKIEGFDPDDYNVTLEDINIDDNGVIHSVVRANGGEQIYIIASKTTKDKTILLDYELKFKSKDEFIEYEYDQDLHRKPCSMVLGNDGKLHTVNYINIENNYFGLTYSFFDFDNKTVAPTKYYDLTDDIFANIPHVEYGGELYFDDYELIPNSNDNIVGLPDGGLIVNIEKKEGKRIQNLIEANYYGFDKPKKQYLLCRNPEARFPYADVTITKEAEIGGTGHFDLIKLDYGSVCYLKTMFLIKLDKSFKKIWLNELRDTTIGLPYYGKKEFSNKYFGKPCGMIQKMDGDILEFTTILNGNTKSQESNFLTEIKLDTKTGKIIEENQLIEIYDYSCVFPGNYKKIHDNQYIAWGVEGQKNVVILFNKSK